MKQTERKNKNRLFKLLLFALVMLLPIGASGQTDYGITVGGVDVTIANADDVSGGDIVGTGTVSYDAESNTLKLNDVTIGEGTGIQCTGNLNLSIIGTVTVTGSITSSSTTGAKLTLKNGDNNAANLTELTYSPSSGGSASGFTSVVYDGMYLSATNARNVKYSPTRQRYEESPSSSISTIYFSSAETYELWLGGTKVTSANKDDILGSQTIPATAKFDPSNNTLTLNGISLSSTSIYNSGIISRLPNLKIVVNGNNSITCNDSCTAIRADVEGTQTLTIEYGGNNGSLSFDAYQAIRDFKTLTLTGLYWGNGNNYAYENATTTGNSGAHTGKKVVNLSDDPVTEVGNATLSVLKYNIKVGGEDVTYANASNITGDDITTGTVSYNANTYTLTLNGATIGGDIEYWEDEELTIVVNGVNTAGQLYSYQGVMPDLIFKKDENATGVCKLTLSDPDYTCINEFDKVDFGDMYLQTSEPSYYANGLGLKTRTINDQKTATITSEPYYPLWIGNTQVSEENKDHILGSTNTTVKFTPATANSNNTLILEDATLTDNIYYSENSDLTIALKGTNTSTSFIEHPNTESNTSVLYFTKAEGATDCSLKIDVSNSGNNSYGNSCAITGFVDLDLDGCSAIVTGTSTHCFYSSPYGIMVDSGGAAPDDATNVTIQPYTSYQLWVAGKQVNANNASDVFAGTANAGKVIFTLAGADSGNNTLTLKGAELGGNIISGLGDLTINIQDANTIAVADTSSVIRSIKGGKLTITKTGDAPTLELSNTRLSYYHAPSIKDFDSFELSEGLYLSNTRAYNSSDYVTPAVYDTYINNYGGQTTMGLINPTDMDKGSKGIRNVTISTEVNYPIWVAHHKQQVGAGYNMIYAQINNTNKDDIFEDDVPKVSFVPASGDNNNINTLRLNGAAILSAIVTSLPNLTIEFSGENSLDKDGKVDGFIHGVANSVLTFKAIADESEIQLYSANDYAVVEGFGDVKFIDAVAQYGGNFSYNKTTRRYENQYGAMTLLTIADDITTYGLTINTESASVVVTSANRKNVLNENLPIPTVQFDGLHTLILNDADLESIVIGSNPSFASTGLTIYLAGEDDQLSLNGTSTIIDDNNKAIYKDGDGDNINVTFSTDRENPGKLTCSYSDAANLFPKVNAFYYNLAPNVNTATQRVTIMQSMQPIVSTNDPESVNNGGDNDPDHPGVGLGADIENNNTAQLTDGVVKNNILYVLPDANDGFYQEGSDKLVFLNSIMTDDAVKAIAGDVEDGTLIPATPAFAARFKGLCFLVPAGNGDIVVETNTIESGKLHICLGRNDVREVPVTTEMTENTIRYSFTKDTYVYLYNAAAAQGTELASRFDGSHRAPGKKMTTTTTIRRTGVRASASSGGSIASAPEPPLNPKTLTKADVDAALETVDDPVVIGMRITDEQYVDIADDAFDNLNGTQTAFIDLSQTSIIDQKVDRTKAPFNKLPNGAFVYLPVGNDVSTASTAKIENVVIGTVCPDMQLSENRPFKAGIDFTAAKAKMDRTFVIDQRSSIFLPFAIDKEKVTELGTFYEFTGVTDGKVIMTPLAEGKGTEANIPYMFKPAKESLSFDMVDVKSVLAETPFHDGVAFEGTYEQIEILSTSDFQYYCFMNDDGKFVHVVDQPVTVKPFRAYLVKAGSVSLSNVFDIDWGDDTTGLNDVRSKVTEVRSDVFFDLQGRQVKNPTTKGIYIQNGKKVVIK